MPTAMGTASGSRFQESRRAPFAPAASIVAASLLCLAGVTAHAGTVTGTVQIEPNRLGKPPARNQGFLPRIENPLRPVKRFDPRSAFVVVLEDGPVSDEDRVPPNQAMRYELLGASFAVPVLPVLAGAQVELKNRGFDTPTLMAPDAPGVLDPVELRPNGVHAFRVPEPLQPVVIRAQGSPHLQGTVVAFPHRYFAIVDERGRFEIPNVPPGSWRARVWYREGWLEGVEERIEVSARRASVTIKVSPVLKVAAP